MSAMTLTCPITAHDVKVLKHADSVVFRLLSGQGTIEAFKRGENTRDGFEQKHAVYCDTRVIDYGRYHHGVERAEIDVYAAFTMYGSAQYDPTLKTLLSRIRAGDTVRLLWVRGNDNDAGRAIGWSRDELRLVITNDKTKDETYLVAVQVGPDNYARMIQLAR